MTLWFDDDRLTFDKNENWKQNKMKNVLKNQCWNL